MCNVFQVCQAPNWQLQGEIRMTCIPPRVMHSVSVDIFSPPSEKWQGVSYDDILVSVDRLSGWVLAIPTQKTGLTGAKAAHLMLEHGWNIFGIPAVVTSDNGPQFASQWWQTCVPGWGYEQLTDTLTDPSPMVGLRWWDVSFGRRVAKLPWRRVLTGLRHYLVCDCC